jgi:hypothetical protein
LRGFGEYGWIFKVFEENLAEIWEFLRILGDI